MAAGYYRHPTIHDDTIVFISEDDLWTVSVDGGIARRLTSNLGEVTTPRLSPDGSLLAFVGREEGGPEVYVMPSDGGQERRLTYLNSNSHIVGWSQDGKEILFTTSYGQVNRREMALFSIRADAENGEITPLPYGPAGAIAYGPDGAIVIGRNTGDSARWKRYRGGTAGHLWIDRNGDGEFVRLLEALSGNIGSPMWLHANGDSRIYFVSDHEGIGNLYSCLPDGNDIRRHSDHADYYARNPSTDGQRIVYHAGADIYVYDPVADSSVCVEVAYRSPRVRRNRRFVDSSRYLDSYNLHPSGKALALTTRGKPFAFYNQEGPVLQYGKRDGVRYRHATWLSDGHRLALITDEPGEETLVVFGPDPTAEPRLLEGLDLGRIVELRTSPTEDMVALSNHRNELLVVNIESSEITIIDQGGYSRIGGFDWSPDGAWLAYSFSRRMNTSEIRLYHVLDDEATSEADSDAGDKTREDTQAAVDVSEHEEDASPRQRRFTITRPVLHDVLPSFDPDGRYLYFLSHREFNPVYDGLHFDLGFPWGMRPYLITLQSDLPNPFIPRPDFDDETPDSDEDDGADTDDELDDDEFDGEDGDMDADDIDDDDDADESVDDTTEHTLNADAVDAVQPPDLLSVGEKNGSAAPKKSDKKDDKPPRIQIDLDGIEERILPFPVQDARYGQIIGIPGKALFTVFSLEGTLDQDIFEEDSQDDGELRMYDFKEYKVETLFERISDFSVSANGKKLAYRTGNRLRVINAGEKPPSGPNRRKNGWIDMQRIKVSVDPQSEWEQMYREAWRLQRDQFWSENMSQVDWQTVYHRYFALIERVSTRGEFSDLMWEMQGELGTSHAYEFGGDYLPRPYYGQGFLGAEFSWDESADGYVINNVLHGDAWDERTNSPLAAPGVDVRDGDVMLALNGQRLDQQTSPPMLLVNQAGNEVLLTLAARDEPSDSDLDQQGSQDPKAEQQDKSTDGEDEGTEPTLAERNTRSVVVKSIISEAPARYRRWVEDNRAAVHAATDGRVGYVHIPDMGPTGYAEFHRGYLTEIDRDALIVDVRYNGGGHVSQLILEKLARRRLGYDLSRWGGLIPYPIESVAGPLVALTNEHAGSDGDIFCHSFKLMKLGPLVGKRTWGGVIGIYPRHTLVDGTVTTQPEYSFWFEDVGWNVENYGTDPDIEVDIKPQDYAAGRDPQLERSIQEVLRLLEENPVERPVMEPPPSRALPALPPR